MIFCSLIWNLLPKKEKKIRSPVSEPSIVGKFELTLTLLTFFGPKHVMHIVVLSFFQIASLCVVIWWWPEYVYGDQGLAL